MDIIFLEEVQKNNIDEHGNLQPGLYHVAYNMIRTFSPLFIAFDGNKWDHLSIANESSGPMYVYFRSGNL